MLPRADIIAWRSEAPWASDDDVEQDLIITRALLDVFSDQFLSERLAFRGGTALHRLYLAPAARYSEDIDLVQRIPEGIGPTFDRIRERLAWLGKPKRQIVEIPKLWFPFETDAGGKRKLKIEISTHEHFAGVLSKTYAVDHPAATGSVEIPRIRSTNSWPRSCEPTPSATRDATCSTCGGPRNMRPSIPRRSFGSTASTSRTRARLLTLLPSFVPGPSPRTSAASSRMCAPVLRSGIQYDSAVALEWFEA